MITTESIDTIPQIALASLMLLLHGCNKRPQQAKAKFFQLLHAALLAVILLAVTRKPEYPILHQAANIRILNSTQSITGRIVVGDNLSLGYRFLRCDHSLLGGRWIKENEAGKQMLGDS
jgi:hypothetical protein